MFKRIIKTLIIWTLILYFVSGITTGLEFKNGFIGLIITALALAIASRFAKPIINILLLPINLITFGFFRFLNNVVALFLVSLIIPDFKVGGFALKGFGLIPSFALPAGLLSYIAFSLLFSLVGTIIYWLID